MTLATLSTANQWPPINTPFDRQAALPALIQACYRKTTKRSRFYFAPFWRLFETVENHELTNACLASGYDENYIKATPVGIVFDEFIPSHEQLRSAFLWLLRHPKAVKNIIVVRDILHGNTCEPFYIGDLLTCKPATPSPQLPRTVRSRRKHDLLITYLTAMKIGPLRDLEEVVGGDCRQILLDLRGMGYNIVVGVQSLDSDLEITISLNK